MDTDFDFQDWARLARVSPEAFEARRREAIETFLAGSAPEQRNLGRRLQREIDFEIRRADSPQQAFVAITTMVRDQMAFLCEELVSLNDSLVEFDALTRTQARLLAEALAPAEPQSMTSRN